MFLQASKQRFQSDAHRQWQHSSDVLHLPWLCPVLYSVVSCPRRASTIARVKPKNKLRPSRPGLFQPAVTVLKCQRRRLASAATAVYDPPQDDFIPFEGSQLPQKPSSSVQHPWLRQSGLSTILESDPTSPIIIIDGSTSRSSSHRSVDSISSDAAEIIQTLHACIQVDRLRRAAILMRRLNSMFEPGAPELLAAHNDYLRELLHKCIQTGNKQLLDEIYKWFEVGLRHAGVTPDANTYALMIQATLQLPNRKRFGRTIQRFVSLADEAGVRDRSLAILQTLCTEQDFGEVTRAISNCIDQIIDHHIVNPPEADTSQEPIYPPTDDAFGAAEVKETPQKGLSLMTLKKSLSIFSNPTPMALPSDESSTEDERSKSHAFRRQQKLENDTYQSAIQRWRSQSERLKEFGISVALYKGTVGASMWNWHEKLVPLIKEEIRNANKAEEKIKRGVMDSERCRYGPFLQILPPDKLSAITILTCMKIIARQSTDTKGAPLASVLLTVGGAIEDEYLAEKIKNRHVQNGRKFPDRLRMLTSMAKRQRSRDSSTRPVGTPDLLHDDAEALIWTTSIKVRIGAVLVSFLTDVAKMEVSCIDPRTGTKLRESQPVFVHSFLHSRGKRKGMLRFNKAMYDELAAGPAGCTLSKHLPMIVEPKPWTSYREGAFLEQREPVVRLHVDDPQSRNYAIAAANNGDMKQMFAGLNALARTRWRVNRDVFKIMLAAWNSGEATGKIVAENVKAVYPSEPAASDDKMVRRRWIHEIQKIENQKASNKSQRCFQNLQLDVARAYLNEVFYFPHNLDFRGRAYPMVPFFNHMGADPVRGLLIFDRGKELGEGGLKWLKTHLANLYGYDKASFEERRKFTDDHLSDVVDSATNPLGGNRWWLQAEDPWQCLGACMELKKALDEPDPHRFISHLPIHQDGTCNGLQHYAALGGDPIGAKQVNLVPGERPADIYTAVAEMVKAEVADDAAQGNELAALLDGKLTRKVVKQTVMTNVYGVTFLGAMRQVQIQLQAIFTDFPDTKTLNITTASSYISRKIFKSLSTMFIGAHDIQHWLAECASRITTSIGSDQINNLQDQVDGKVDPHKAKKGKSAFDYREHLRTTVIWTTPLKMPVVQPYRKSSKKSVLTNLQRISLTSPLTSDPVDKRKQLQAFPPNFIHSLDATHMMLTALKCDEIGLTFASVHDSFWTHAGDVDTMNRIIRDAFIRMHSEDIIGRLRAEFSARCKGSFIYVSIDKHSATGQKIAAWRLPHGSKHGRSSKLDELLMENRRLKLLASKKPEERLEGESMVTAGRIFEETANDNDLISVETRDLHRLGQVPQRKENTKMQADEQNVAERLDDSDHPKLLLDGIAGSEDDETLESFEEGDEQNGESESDEAQGEVEEAKIRRKKTLWLWRPMSFPPVPKKGNFDISKLRDSQYFFS